MITFKLEGGKKMEAYLSNLKEKMNTRKKLKAGFFTEDVYPDGQPVAEIATTQNFGDPDNNLPPRPFFTFAVDKGKLEWGDYLGLFLKSSGFNKDTALGLLGNIAVKDIQIEIETLTEPALSPLTVVMRYLKREYGEDSVNIFDAVDYLESDGVPEGADDKPLMDTLKMLHSVKWKLGT